MNVKWLPWVPVTVIGVCFFFIILFLTSQILIECITNQSKRNYSRVLILPLEKHGIFEAQWLACNDIQQIITTVCVPFWYYLLCKGFGYDIPFYICCCHLIEYILQPEMSHFKSMG